MSNKGNKVHSENVKEDEAHLEVDQTSVEGKFSWCQVSLSPPVCLPQILRTQPDGSTVSHVSVRMAEKTLLEKFFKSLPYEVTRIPSVLAHPLTVSERRLLFEVNRAHCDNLFGEMEKFSQDHLVNSEEFCHYVTFLSLSQARIKSSISQANNRFGFLRINGTGDVPYVVVQHQKLIPLFYFEEAGTESVSKVSVSDWDWAYLKLCCKVPQILHRTLISPMMSIFSFQVQGEKDSMLVGSVCPCITEEEVKMLLPAGTSLEEYWPKKDLLNKSVRSKACKEGWWTSTSPGQESANISSGAAGPGDTRYKGT